MIDIKELAKLSKLIIKEEEIPVVKKKIQNIIDGFANLPDGIDSSTLREEDQMRLRSDEEEPSMSRDDVLSNAPQKQAGCIVVPKIV